MKRSILIAPFISLLLTACTYDAPLAPEAILPIDRALLGTWEVLPNEGDEPSAETVVVREDGENRYKIEHRDGDSVIYFDAWPGEIEGVRFLQLEVTGDDDGPAEPGEPDLYSVIDYRFDGDDIIMRSLNTEFVDHELGDTAALREAFIKHRDNPELFIEPGRLRRL